MAASASRSTFAVPHQPQYDHTQWAPMYWLILLPGLAVLLVAGLTSGDPKLVVPFLLLGIAIIILAFSFRSLRVVDEGDYLAVRFGPLPLFRKRIAYASIMSAEPDRSSFIDGWGIHWVPGRGWTYNLWGYDCVRISFSGGKTIRIGTDDPQALAKFLQERRGGRA